jgi:hypothetical protein
MFCATSLTYCMLTLHVRSHAPSQLLPSQLRDHVSVVTAWCVDPGCEPRCPQAAATRACDGGAWLPCTSPSASAPLHLPLCICPSSSPTSTRLETPTPSVDARAINARWWHRRTAHRFSNESQPLTLSGGWQSAVQQCGNERQGACNPAEASCRCRCRRGCCCCCRLLTVLCCCCCWCWCCGCCCCWCWCWCCCCC